MTANIDELLRAEGQFAADTQALPLRHLIVLFVIGGATYGLALGTFGYRPAQMLYSGLKVPLLLIVATILSLPTFYVVNLALGLADDFVAALKGIFSAQATFAILLGSLAPLPLVFYHATGDYRLALNFNGLPFLMALLGAQINLARHYQPLIRRNPTHRLPLRLWFFLYAAVTMQSAWVLRPFVGDPNLPTTFMRRDAWSNAFVEIGADLVTLLGLQ